MSARIFAVPLSFAILVILSGNASAQYGRPGDRRQNAPQPTPFSKSGTVESMNGSSLIISAASQKYMVGMTQQTEIHVTGKAEPDYLAPRMFVEFVADISDKGDGKDKVEKLTICTPTADRQAGLSAPIVSEGKSKDKDKDADNMAADKNKEKAADKGMDSKQAAADAAAMFDTPAGGKKGRAKSGGSPFDQGGSSASKTKHASTEKLPGNFTVRGIVKSYKNHKLVVSTGHGPQIKVDISETAEINVDTSDLHVVSQGDSVKVKGQGLQNRVLADSISIALSNPLTGIKKKSSRIEKPAKAASKEEAKPDGN